MADIAYNVVVGACKRPWLWTHEDGRSWPMPCGKCLACRIRRRSVWSIRMLHEMEQHEKSCFITLTYAPEKLPRRGDDERGILVKSDLQNFFKRLRKAYAGINLKYYACGEYGERDISVGGTSRPHYHAIIFGLQLEYGGEEHFSQETTEIWGLGRADSQPAEAGSIRYVAGYVSKKLGLHEYKDSGRPAPFQLSSQGIGTQWAAENMVEILTEGCLNFRGKKLPIPRLYLDKLEEMFPEAVEGFSVRRSFESDLALSDLILEMLPEYGGRKFQQLTAEEKENVLIQLQKRGQVIDGQLRSRERFKEYKL